MSYAEVLEKINLFHIDANFTASIVPYLTMMLVHEKEIIFREGDISEESYFILYKRALKYCVVFFLSSGKVRYTRIDGISFMNIEEGMMFGELETLENINRTCFAQAKEISNILICKKEDFQNLLKEFPLINEKVFIF